MASYAPLPAYVNPANAMINFQPLSDALGDYNKGMTVAGESTAKINAANAMAAGDYQRAQGELAKVDPRAAMEVGMYPGKKEGQENELRIQTAKMLGGHAQTILDMYGKDPESADLAARRWLSSDPKFAKGLEKMGVADWQNNPRLAIQTIHDEALGAQDPEKQALMRAQTAATSVKDMKQGDRLVNINPGSGARGETIAEVPQRMPQGYEPDPTNPGGARPIVGGPADIKFTEAKQKALTAVEATGANLKNLESDIQRVLNHPGLGGNFGVMGKLPNWPGGDAANANALIEQLRAKGGFSTLQAMREASKTGGALGNVSNAEGIRLENAFAALQNSQSEDQVRQNLKNVLQITKEIGARMQDAYARQYSADQPAQTPTRQAPGTVVNGPAAGPTVDKPNTGRLPPGVDAAEAISQARAAIAGGKNPNLVRQRLQQLGIDPGQL